MSSWPTTTPKRPTRLLTSSAARASGWTSPDEAAVADLGRAHARRARPHRRVLLQRRRRGRGAAWTRPMTRGSPQWELHVMSHVYAARAVLPSMLAPRRGLPGAYRQRRGACWLPWAPRPIRSPRPPASSWPRWKPSCTATTASASRCCVPQGVNTAMAPAAARRRRHRRHRGTRVCGRGHHRGHGRGTVPDPLPPRGPDLRGTQVLRPRPLAPRHAPPPPTLPQPRTQRLTCQGCQARRGLKP